MTNFEFQDLSDNTKLLFKEAIKVRENAYCPYSNFKVGAALLGSNDKIYTGCNIESADFTLTSHAEMVAVDSMIKSGNFRVKELLIVMVCGEEVPVPCGLCRQKISEFINTDISIYAVNMNEDQTVKLIYEFKLSELYPYSFNSKSFK